MDGRLVTKYVGLGMLLIGILVATYELIAHKSWTPMATLYSAFMGMLLMTSDQSPISQAKKKK